MFKYAGIKIIYISVLLLILSAIFITIKSLFIPLIISIFMAIVLRPIVSYFESKGFSHNTIIITIFTSFIILTTISLITVLPILMEQIVEFSNNFSTYIDTIKEYLSKSQETIKKKITFIDFTHLSKNIQNSFGSDLNNTTEYLISYVSNFMNILTFTLLIPFFTFFILKDMHVLNKTLLSYVPNRYFEIFLILFYKIGESIQSYIRGQIIDASFVGVMTAIGLSIIGFPFALLIGLIAGIGNLVPYFGPLLGAIPAVLIMLVTPEWANSSGALSVLSVFLTVQIIENIFIYPIAVGNSVKIHPAIILVSLLIGGELAGIVGMIIAIPLVAIVKVTFEILHGYLNSYKIIG